MRYFYQIICILLLTHNFIGITNARRRSDDDESWFTFKNALKLGAGLATGAGAILAAPVLLGAAGFTAGGVALGSVGAGIQGMVYGGATAGAFSIAQSVGAGGLGMVGKAVVGHVGAAIGSKAVDYVYGQDN